MGDRTLWYLIVDDNKPVGEIFDVAAAPSLTINGLKKKIFPNEDPPVLRQISLWKPTQDLPDDKILKTMEGWQLNRDTGEVEGRAVRLSPSSTVGDEFSSLLPTRCVHVLVQLPPREGRNIGLRMRRL